MRIDKHHVAGHDDDVVETYLDRWALINIECDYRAKFYMTDIIKNYKQPKSVMPKGLWQVKICGIPIGTNLVTYLRKSISRATLFEYWANTKNRIAEEQVAKIDWEVQGKVTRSNKYSRQQWVSKVISG